MTFKKKNPWKYLSVSLLGIIAIGLLAPVSAAPPSGNADSQLEALFILVEEVLTTVQGIDTDLEDLSGNITAIKTETDKIQMVKDDVGTIKTTTDAIKTETDKIQMVKDDVGSIKTDVSSLVSSGTNVFRIVHTFGDGADDKYDGYLNIDRISGSGVYQIEKLYLCDLKVGSDTGAGDGLEVYYTVDGERLEDPDGIFGVKNSYFHDSLTGVNPGCVDLLYSNVLDAQLNLAGDGSNDVKITLEETDIDGVEGDDNDAQLVAYISGLSEPGDIAITSTTADS